MNERPHTDDTALPDDPAPASDPEPTPRYPDPSRKRRDARPETLADNVKVTPLDPDHNIGNGIEVNET